MAETTTEEVDYSTDAKGVAYTSESAGASSATEIKSIIAPGNACLLYTSSEPTRPY